MTYNGYANYETWCVSLWLDNDEGTYNLMREQARQVLGDNDGNVSEAKYQHAQWLKEFHDELADDILTDASVFSDLLKAALSEVDWYEIAENHLEEIAES